MTDEQQVSAAHRPAQPTRAPCRAKVLVADDDPKATAALSSLLESDGFSVQTASDGADALEKIAQSPPDVLVTDVNMPHLDGFGLMRAVRERYPRIFIVVISGEHHSAARLIEGGALAYVGKPFDADEVISVIDAAMQMRDEQLSR